MKIWIAEADMTVVSYRTDLEDVDEPMIHDVPQEVLDRYNAARKAFTDAQVELSRYHS